MTSLEGRWCRNRPTRTNISADLRVRFAREWPPV